MSDEKLEVIIQCLQTTGKYMTSEAGNAILCVISEQNKKLLSELGIKAEMEETK